MNKILIILLFAIVTSSCNQTNNNSMNDKIDNTQLKETIVKDTTPKVTGIGGVFFQSNNANEINIDQSKPCVILIICY